MSAPSARAQATAAIIVAIRRIVAGSVLSNQRRAEILKLHPTDLQLLNILELSGPTTPKELARASGLSSGGITVVLDRLEKAGYIRRAENPQDRRSLLVNFVRPKAGHPIFALYKDDEANARKLLARYSEKELDLIADVLTRLTTPPETAG